MTPPLPIGMNVRHVKLLLTLAKLGEYKYTTFRAKHNPWRRESYFDAQITWLSKKGLCIITGNRTIYITDYGKQLCLPRGEP